MFGLIQLRITGWEKSQHFRLQGRISRRKNWTDFGLPTQHASLRPQWSLRLNQKTWQEEIYENGAFVGATVSFVVGCLLFLFADGKGVRGGV